MIVRTPSSTAVPPCYGRAWSESSEQCDACPVQARCAKSCMSQHARPTLSQLTTLWMAKLETEVESGEGDDIVSIYRKQYQKHFGQAAGNRILFSERSKVAFSKAERWCAENGVGLEIYIGAQMHMLKSHVRSSPYGFQPNMLSGPKAVERYNRHVEFLQRRYRTAHASTNNAATGWGKICEQVLIDSVSIAEDYVSCVVAGMPMKTESEEWEDRSRSLLVRNVWRAIHTAHTEVDDVRQQLRIQYRKENIDNLRTASLWYAAENVSHRYGDSLSRYMVVKWPISWRAMGEFFASICQPRNQSKTELSTVPGLTWSPAGENARIES